MGKIPKNSLKMPKFSFPIMGVFFWVIPKNRPIVSGSMVENSKKCRSLAEFLSGEARSSVSVDFPDSNSRGMMGDGQLSKLS